MFRMRKVAVVLVAALAALLSSSSRVSADVVFDPLTAPAGGHGARDVAATPGGVSNTAFGISLLGGSLIGDRVVNAAETAVVSPLLGTSITAAAVSGKVTLSNDATVTGNGYVQYNFATGLNFTPVANIILNQAIADLNLANASITLFNGVLNQTTGAMNFPTGVAADLTIPLAGIAAGILNNVTAFRINLNTGGQPDRDLSFGPISFTNPPENLPPVPEPATLATFGLIGLVGGVVARRKMKAQVA